MARVDLVVANAETAEFDRRTVSPAYQCDRPGLRQIFEAVAADRLQRDRAVTEGDTAPLHAVAIRTCLPEIGVQLRQPPSVCRQLCHCIRRRIACGATGTRRLRPCRASQDRKSTR